jgi:hypothetical protein
MRNTLDLPAGLPVPQDDGACDHLLGTRIPEVWLASTDGFPVNLIIDDGWIAKVFYPVFPPDQSAEQALKWLMLNRPAS